MKRLSAATPPDDSVDSEMVRYYAARADEYDDWYLRRGRYSHGQVHDEAWRSDLEAATAWLASRPFEGRIVELAAGTGWWSPLLAAKGQLRLDYARRSDSEMPGPSPTAPWTVFSPASGSVTLPDLAWTSS